MTLSMKTYKGYNKLPYCNTHYPKSTFTAVADTPESLRLKKNTANQSGVIYQKEFQLDKGKFSAVADDPESLRLAKTQKQASTVAYQGKEPQRVGQLPPPQQAAPTPQQQYQQPPQQQQYQQQPPPPQAAAQSYHDVPDVPQPVPVAAAAPVAPAPVAAPVAPQPKYVALYDYTAADDDEVSFNEGDYILNGEIIDDGWMTGQVERTGQHGMLPSNYVEKC